jgi:hypothetical protein
MKLQIHALRIDALTEETGKIHPFLKRLKVRPMIKNHQRAALHRP